MKEKKCRYCKEKFTPFNSLQPFCFKNECITKHNKTTLEKKKAKAKKEFRENDKSTLLKLAQTVVNRYIRLRDKNNSCISCDYVWGQNNHQRQAHASHYISTSKSRKLRFNEFNVHKSCQICNTHLSGNLSEYRIRLIKKIGIEKVEWLEKIGNSSEQAKYSIEDYKEIIKTYKEKIKELSINIL